MSGRVFGVGTFATGRAFPPFSVRWCFLGASCRRATLSTLSDETGRYTFFGTKREPASDQNAFPGHAFSPLRVWHLPPDMICSYAAAAIRVVRGLVTMSPLGANMLEMNRTQTAPDEDSGKWAVRSGVIHVRTWGCPTANACRSSLCDAGRGPRRNCVLEGVATLHGPPANSVGRHTK